MPARRRRMSPHPGAAGVRKPPRNETAGRKGVEVADATYVHWRTSAVRLFRMKDCTPPVPDIQTDLPPDDLLHDP